MNVWEMVQRMKKMDKWIETTKESIEVIEREIEEGQVDGEKAREVLEMLIRKNDEWIDESLLFREVLKAIEVPGSLVEEKRKELAELWMEEDEGECEEVSKGELETLINLTSTK